MQITGYSAKDPDVKLLDFYFVKDSRLYTVLFTVKPKSKFTEYENLFDRMIQSFDFLSTSAARLIANPLWDKRGLIDVASFRKSSLAKKK